MICSYQGKKFIFIHVSKTGGTSIRQVINLCQVSPSEYKACALWGMNREHSVYSEYVKAVPNIHEFYIFGFVRNPYSRLVSLYHYWKDITSRIHPHEYNGGLDTLAVKLPFKEWIKQVVGKSNNRHLLLQTHWFEGGDIDFIGKMEHLNNDFETVCNKIGIPRCKLEKKNQSEHDHWTKYYDGEIADLVFDYYRMDFETYGYRRGSYVRV